ncbi:MAG: hypothetical protein WCD37_18215 [Chloroflexia bacterium]
MDKPADAKHANPTSQAASTVARPPHNRPLVRGTFWDLRKAPCFIRPGQ